MYTYIYIHIHCIHTTSLLVSDCPAMAAIAAASSTWPARISRYWARGTFRRFVRRNLCFMVIEC